MNTLSFLRDIIRFTIARKKYWLFPVIIILVVLGIVLVFAGGSSLGPLIYTLF
jgi:hypothetical protein